MGSRTQVPVAASSRSHDDKGLWFTSRPRITLTFPFTTPTAVQFRPVGMLGPWSHAVEVLLANMFREAPLDGPHVLDLRKPLHEHRQAHKERIVTRTDGDNGVAEGVGYGDAVLRFF